MTGDEIVRFDHWLLLYRLAGVRNPFQTGEPEEAAPHPTPDSFWSAATLWRLAGEDAALIADSLDKACRRLFSGGTDDGWKGATAELFSDKVEAVVRYAREIARLCDSEHDKPCQGGKTRLHSTAERRDTLGFRQCLRALGDFVESIQNDDALPPPPWSREAVWD